jgi:hypothetical protein
MTKKLDAELVALMDKYAGDGVSTAIEDRAFWLDDGYGNVEGGEWLRAIARIDESGDKAALIALLKSDEPLPPVARQWIADLLSRYELKRKRRGRPRTPNYDRSDAEALLLLAMQRYRGLREEGLGQSEAIEQAAQSYSLSPDVVRNAVEGRRGSSRKRPA